MRTPLVVTVIARDRPGVVERVADALTAHGASWRDSSMAHLAGQFAGILVVDVDEEQAAALAESLSGLEGHGIQVVVQRSAYPGPESRPTVHLELVGYDKVGIVREVSQELARAGVNVERFQSDVSPASMSAELLFRAEALLQLPESLSIEALQERLEGIAHGLMIDLSLSQDSEEA
jgi:glycine cleavage system regulatory protein